MGKVHHTAVHLPVGFTPGIEVEDRLAAYWLGQVTMTLRREIAWLWHERGTLRGLEVQGSLPPPVDSLSDALDLMRFDAERNRFFQQDETARYLSERMAAAKKPGGVREHGGFAWLAETLNLQPCECFALALALGGVLDSARGSVIAACQNETQNATPDMGLLQRLWHAPDEVLGLLDQAHPLIISGILMLGDGDWNAPLKVHPLIARQLLSPSTALPAALAPILPDGAVQSDASIDLAMARLRTKAQTHLTLIPMIGTEDAPFAAVAAQISQATGVQLLQPRTLGDLEPLIVLAWLRNAALIVPYGRLLAPGTTKVDLPKIQLPVPIFVTLRETDPVAGLPPRETIQRIKLKPLGHDGRLAVWQFALPEMWAGQPGRAALTDCARRFAFEESAIRRVANELRALDVAPTREALFNACRDDLDLGDLAQPVTPRFSLAELMLPPKQTEQIRQITQAAQVLSTVHHEWGLAQAWNESGISALFTGPPGTGKTMAAEAIANALARPMYRIDLSQVVNKYIGETEKNLRRVFDAADSGDAILFFDEADALFGKRTEVKEAHDRYANLEISYLLERIERFKGMALLATNRKKDLDDAFLRRLRYIVNFPLPGAEERLRIWQAVMPKSVDTSGLDLPFLAERLPLSGGYIRSAVFNACLQSVVPDQPSTLAMGAIVRAVKGEFDKLGRTVSLDQFGKYASEVRDEP